MESGVGFAQVKFASTDHIVVGEEDIQVLVAIWLWDGELDCLCDELSFLSGEQTHGRGPALGHGIDVFRVDFPRVTVLNFFQNAHWVLFLNGDLIGSAVLAGTTAWPC
jgi:hypothetical protein